MLARPLVNSIVAGLSIDLSPNVQTPRMFMRFHFFSIAASSRRNGDIDCVSRETSDAEWVNS